MAFDGSLIRFGSSSSGAKLPLKYIQAKSYKVTPNRRQDLEPYRDANGLLHRNTLSHTATTVLFTTPPMWNDKMDAFTALLRSHYVNTQEGRLQKKINLYYYCPDTGGYKSGTFYVPDLEFNIDIVRKDKHGNWRMLYYPLTVEFIEY